MSVQISYKKQFIFGLMLLLIFLAIVEGFVRIYEYDPECDWITYDVFEGKKDLAFQICEDIKLIKYNYGDDFHTFVPNQHFPTFNTNSYGFRGDELDKEKSSDIFRVFLVGGSSAASIGATSDNSTIAALLQKQFTQTSLPFHVQVIDAGVGGSYSYEETIFVKNYLTEFEPDLILAYGGANDARYLLLDESPPYKKNYELGNFKFSDLAFYRTPFVIYTDFIRPTFYDVIDYETERSELLAEKWKNRWKSVCDLGQSSGFQTIVILQPALATTTKILTADEKKIWGSTSNIILTKKIMQHMKENFDELEQSCTDVVDLRDVFNGTNDPIFFDDVHVSDVGNKLIAEKLFTKILPIIEKNS